MKRKSSKTLSLGDLIVVLFQEAEKLTAEPAEQQVMVCAALQDLLTRVVYTRQPIGLRI